MTTPSVVRAARGGPGAKLDTAGDGGEPTKGKKGKKNADGSKKKMGKKKLIIIVVAVLVVALVGYKFLAPKKAVKPGPPKPGAVVAMTATTLNLADGHFLKLQLGLQEIAKPKDATIDTSKASDIAIGEFTNMTMASLATDSQRAKAKADLLKKLEAAYPGDLMDVYFVDFVMQ
jgi:flagellar FliL protein